jgi:hypothetical protein
MTQYWDAVENSKKKVKLGDKKPDILKLGGPKVHLSLHLLETEVQNIGG